MRHAPHPPSFGYDMDLRSFLTGSQVYGTPRPESDIDLVVFVTPSELEKLKGMADISPACGGNSGDGPDRPFDNVGCPPLFGKLNLLCVTDEKAYRVWRKGTFQLKRKKPVTRPEVVQLFTELREKAGLVKKREGGLLL